MDLVMAASNGNLNGVRQLINDGAHVNYHHQCGDTPLTAAIDAGHVDVVRLLLASKAKPNIARTDTKDTPLHIAADRDNVAIVELLLGEGASLEAAGRYGYTPVATAISSGSVAAMNALVAAGAVLPANALYVALLGGSARMVEALVAHGCDPNAEQVGSLGIDVPAATAVRDENLPCLEALVKLGARVDHTDLDAPTLHSCLKAPEPWPRSRRSASKDAEPT